MDSRTARIVAEGFHKMGDKVHAEVEDGDYEKEPGEARLAALWDQAEAWEIVADRLEREEAKAKEAVSEAIRLGKELLPCPWCGNPPMTEQGNDGEGYTDETFVSCETAGCIGKSMDSYVTPAQWNTRVVPVLVTPEKEEE